MAANSLLPHSVNMNKMYTDPVGRSDMPIQVFIGIRGVGKTYPLLWHSIYDKDKKWLLMRRTSEEMKTLCNDFANPYKSIMVNEGIEIKASYINKYNVGFFDLMEGDEKVRNVSTGVALSTFSKMRGLDFSDITDLIFDEFIPEKHVNKIREEGEAFLHAYETINRNRELEGRPPLRVYLLANAINLNNDILLKLGCVTVIAKMMQEGKKRYTDKKRGVYVELLSNDLFVAEKSRTTLYQLAGDSNFTAQSLKNQFTGDDMRLIKKDVPINEYNPIFVLEDYVVYQHKATGDMHIRKSKASSKLQRYVLQDKDVLYWRFAPKYRMACLTKTISYDDYTTKLIFDAVTSR